MQELPTMQVTQGSPIDDEFTLRGQDLTGWTGEVRFLRRYTSVRRGYDFTGEGVDPIATVTPSLTVTGGNTVVATTVADTAGFPVLERVGFFVTARAEYRLTGPSGEVQLFQRPVAVAGRL
jgi:hypothetical protein